MDRNLAARVFRPALCAMLLVGSSTAGAQSETQFHGMIVNPGVDPSGLRGDLNQDGIADFVMKGLWSLSPCPITVAASQGGGSYQSLPAIGAVSPGHSHGLTDADQDGLLDVVVSWGVGASDFDGGVQLLLNGGNGVLSPQVPVASGGTLVAIEPVDLNGDGFVDIVGSNPVNAVPQLRVVTGPSFAAATAVYPTAPWPGIVRSGDLTGDGQQDIVVFHGQADSRAVAWIQQGPGQLQQAGSVELPSNLKGGLLLDLTSDQTPDLVAYRGDQVVFAASDGTGGFSTIRRFGPQQGIFLVSACRLGEIDGDGVMDLSIEHAGQLSALRSHPGGPSAPDSILALGLDLPVQYVDADLDGLVDMIAGPLFVRGSGGGQFQFAQIWSHHLSPTAAPAADIIASDWNRDGRLDVATVLQSPESSIAQIESRLANSTFQFPQQPSAVSSGASSGTIAALSGDFDGDDLADMVVFSGDAFWWKGDGAGGFQMIASVRALLTPATKFEGATADFDGDHVDDLLVVRRGSSAAFRVVLSQPGAIVPHPQPAVSLGEATGWDLGDANGDGSLDLLLVQSSGAVQLFQGDGAGGFVLTAVAAATSLDSSAGPVVARDLTGDGVVDLAGTFSSQEKVGVRRGVAGSFGFETALLSSSISGSSAKLSIRVGEVDGAPGPELLCSSSIAPRTVVGAIGFSGAPERIGELCWGGASAPAPLDVQDFNGDGRSDLAFVTAHGSGWAACLVGSAPGSSSLGVGTPGCHGVEGLASLGAPNVGNSQYGVISTQAPKCALGILVGGDLPLPGGADSFGIGVMLHVDLMGSTTIAAADIRSDLDGVARMAVPIPSVPALAGASLCLQALWAWDDCVPSPYGLSSSRGIALVIQP